MKRKLQRRVFIASESGFVSYQLENKPTRYLCTEKAWEVYKMKQRLVYDLGVDLDLVDKFEELVQDNLRDELAADCE